MVFFVRPFFTPGGSEVKASACNAGELGLIPGWERSPGEGNGNPLQYSCLENPMDRGAWWASVHGVAKSWTRLSDFTFTFIIYMRSIYFVECISTSFLFIAKKYSIEWIYLIYSSIRYSAFIFVPFIISTFLLMNNAAMNICIVLS